MAAFVGEDEVVELCRDLIRIDTTNAGDNCGKGERKAAEYVAEKLAEVGVEARILESDARRANLYARIEGTDPGRDALLVHGHLDVGPFDEGEARHHPLAGDWAEGRAGHGSMLNAENAVTELAEAVARIGRHQWPVRLTRTTRAFLSDICDALEIEFDENDADATVARLGPLARMIGAGLRNTCNPTMLEGGYKANVIPGRASAVVDGRYLPEQQEEFFATLDGLLGPNVRREFLRTPSTALETPFTGPLVQAMRDAVHTQDPDGWVVPYTMSGGTDLKAFSRLGIRGYGFVPLRLPADLDFSGMFHGVDERVPIDSLRFGVRVLDRFLGLC